MKKISVISGGTSGLGLEIADLLVKSGRNVLILGRNTVKIAEATSRLKRSANNNFAESLKCDIGNEEDVKMAGIFLQKSNFSVEYLFNNAGRGLFEKTESSNSEMIENVFAANLKGMILLTSEILRLSPEENELSIINIMSTSALIGRAEETIYCAAKWGARGYTEALRTELKGRKRNVISVYPGGMKTEFWNIPGLNRNITGFMDPADVAAKIVNAVTVTNKMYVTEITINRKA